METKVLNDKLDMEWIELILEAKKLGVEKEDVRDFLQNYILNEPLPNKSIC
ncbi:anti-repressor SinI family protein [Bacillus sp. DTU_2020_1000418_1_SI_GHA_SEK_038]|uniref:anti-repressor SinI family protein n=1 Tax=Bacillus sp. DTU_2020_1000418_1_SI_GHA_SEK_038 TaxID=3077585 RepID=UPI0028E5196A|nr:anti-repressor SinI family protein [Bacillus sp. DTU_2020_1000418_1_SI_GHA_SEK_038]WNS76384.1 anti-repressor SinI family protein [Bacillus sp. DTU_2020_1000418_1_SI_GHA_SEK_038]